MVTIIINALYWSSYITIMILVVNVKFIWKNEIFYFIPYVPFKIIGGQISHTWVMFPHLGIHIQSFTHLLVLNYNFLTLRVCLLLISQQTFLYCNIFIIFIMSEIMFKYAKKRPSWYRHIDHQIIFILLPFLIHIN